MRKKRTFIELEKEIKVEVANKEMKGGPVYEVGSSINRVYNPCGVICQNAALSSCNRFFSNEATVANIFQKYKEIKMSALQHCPWKQNS